jgi:hypothetical protein
MKRRARLFAFASSPPFLQLLDCELIECITGTLSAPRHLPLYCEAWWLCNAEDRFTGLEARSSSFGAVKASAYLFSGTKLAEGEIPRLSFGFWPISKRNVENVNVKYPYRQ